MSRYGVGPRVAVKSVWVYSAGRITISEQINAPELYPVDLDFGYSGSQSPSTALGSSIDNSTACKNPITLCKLFYVTSAPDDASNVNLGSTGTSKRGKTRPRNNCCFVYTLGCHDASSLFTLAFQVKEGQGNKGWLRDPITPSIPFQSIVCIYPSLLHLHTRRKLDVSPSIPRIDNPHLFSLRQRRSVLHCPRHSNTRYLT